MNIYRHLACTKRCFGFDYVVVTKLIISCPDSEESLESKLHVKHEVHSR